MLTTFMIAVAVLVLIYVMTGVTIVRQGFRYTIEHFGRFVRVADPGFNYIAPFVYRVGRKINMMEQVLEIPGQEIITKDNAMVAVDGVVFFQVLDPAKAAYEVSDLYAAITALSTTNLRTVMGSMDLDETLSKRDEINTRLLSVVDNATESWGVKITRVELRDIRPPQDIVNAMTRQMKAEREKRAVILEAEGMRQSAILKAEGEKQAAILSAEGGREAAFREAEARERAAQAEAAATKAVSDAIESGSGQAINYFIAQKYVEAIAEFARSPNAKTILFPVEATQLIGTLGGIAELAKEAVGGQAGARRPGPGRSRAFPKPPNERNAPGPRLAVANRRRVAADRRADRAGLLPDVHRRGGDRHWAAVPRPSAGNCSAARDFRRPRYRCRALRRTTRLCVALRSQHRPSPEQPCGPAARTRRRRDRAGRSERRSSPRRRRRVVGARRIGSRWRPRANRRRGG
jgi:regulator of protease activity HflC (stomatin/prohibitin superfamily)